MTETVPATAICRPTSEGAEAWRPDAETVEVDATGASLDVLLGAVRALREVERPTVVRPSAFTADTSLDAALDALEDAADAALAWPGTTLSRPAVTGDLSADVASVVGAIQPDPTKTLEAVRAALMARVAGPGDPLEPALRRLDDLPRRLVFRSLRAAWLERARDPFGRLDKPFALEQASALLGEPQKWRRAFRQYTYDGARRMVLIPTWQCELRCTYCWIPKQDGRVMPMQTVDRGVDLAFSTERDAVEIQFFGGEALLEPDRVRRAIEQAEERAAQLGKKVGFLLSSNGWSLGPEQLAWLQDHPVRLELSLDGDAATQERFRPAHTSRIGEGSSYDNSIAAHRDAILASGLEQHVIMVVHPQNVHNLARNFFHIADLGFRRIQINNMLGVAWSPEQMKVWASELYAIGQELLKRQGTARAVDFVNLEHRPTAMRLNGEVTVDHDGTIYGGNSFLHETEHKDRFAIDHLDACTNIDRYWIDATENNYLLDWSYRPTITRNNVEVGRVLASLCAHLRSEGLAKPPPQVLADPGLRAG